MRATARRLLTIPAYAAATLLWTALAPLWIPALALVDALRPRGQRAALRCGAMLAIYLHCEIAGLLASLGLQVARPWSIRERSLERHYALQRWWSGTLFGAARHVFGLRTEVEGETALDKTPFLLFVRHASLADVLLAAALVANPHGIRLRYVLKRELLWDPCLDVVGNRLPNCFVDRSSEDTGAQLRAVRELASGLGPGEGILIYPEGTRFTEAKRRRVLARLAEGGEPDRIEKASGLRHVLPPRTGGPLALLEACPGVDVVVCAHTGLEGSASARDVWRGALLDRVVRVRLWRIPASAIPVRRSERIAWLFEEWSRVDAHVADLGRAPDASGVHA